MTARDWGGLSRLPEPRSSTIDCLASAPARTTLSRTEQASLTELLRMLSRHAFEGARLVHAAEHVQQAGCDNQAPLHNEQRGTDKFTNERLHAHHLHITVAEKGL